MVWTELLRLLEDPELIQAELDRRMEAARNADPLRQREQDLRNERGGPPIGAFDNSKANVYVVPPQQPQTMKPVAPPKATTPAATTDTDDGPSPLVFILPGLVLAAMLAAGYSFARMSRRTAQV